MAILLRWRGFDGFEETRRFEPSRPKLARDWARKRLVGYPEISEHHAMAGDGAGWMTIEGATGVPRRLGWVGALQCTDRARLNLLMPL